MPRKRPKRRRNPDARLSELQREAIASVEAFNDWAPAARWIDLEYRHGTPLGRLLRLWWLTEAVGGRGSILENLYAFLRIPHTRGPKIPPDYHAIHVYEGIEIPVRVAGRAIRADRRRGRFGHRVNVVCPVCRKTFGLGRLGQHAKIHIPKPLRKRSFEYGLLRPLWGQARYDDSGYRGTEEPTYRPDIDFGQVEVYYPKIDVED